MWVKGTKKYRRKKKEERRKKRKDVNMIVVNLFGAAYVFAMLKM